MMPTLGDNGNSHPTPPADQITPDKPQGPFHRRGEWLFLSLLLTVTLIVRSLLAEKTPFAWDSFNYILALESFRPLEDMPHFPGYLPYILLLKGLTAIVREPHCALTLWAVFGGTLAVALQYLLARGPLSSLLGFDDTSSFRFALLASLITACNPMTWYYGEVSLGYVNGQLAGQLGIVLILMGRKKPSLMFAASGAVGVLAGFRPEAFFLGFPLLRFSSAKKHHFGWWFLLVFSVFVGVLAWLLPTVSITGSWEAFFTRGLKTIVGTREGGTALLGGSVRYLLFHNLRLAIYLALAAGPALLLAMFRGKTSLQAWKSFPRAFRRLIIWCTIPLTVFLALNGLVPGYLLVMQPALALLAASLLVGVKWPKDRMAVPVFLIVTLSVAYFLLPAGLPGLQGGPAPCTLSQLRWSEERVESYREATAVLADSTTALVFYDAASYPWRAAMVQFPDLRALQVIAAGNGTLVVEGYRKRERDFPRFNETTGTQLAAIPPNISRLLVYGSSPLDRFPGDFPEFTVISREKTPFGPFYLALRRD